MNCCAKPKRETGTHGAPPTFDADTVRVLDLASKTWTDEEAEGLAGLKGQPETVRKVMATDNAAVRDIMYVTSPGPLNPCGARTPPSSYCINACTQPQCGGDAHTYLHAVCVKDTEQKVRTERPSAPVDARARLDPSDRVQLRSAGANVVDEWDS